jgi:hypothetical protein
MTWQLSARDPQEQPACPAPLRPLHQENVSTTEQLGHCSSSARGVSDSATRNTQRAVAWLAYLPLLQVVLFGPVLLDQVVEHLLQPLGIRLEGGDDILDGALHQHAVNQTEALAVAGERLQSFENESVLDGE